MYCMFVCHSVEILFLYYSCMYGIFVCLCVEILFLYYSCISLLGVLNIITVTFFCLVTFHTELECPTPSAS